MEAKMQEDISKRLEEKLAELGIKEINTITVFMKDPNFPANNKPYVELDIKLIPLADFLVITRVRSTKDDIDEEGQNFYLQNVEPIIRKHLVGLMKDLKTMEEICIYDDEGEERENDGLPSNQN